MMMKHHAHETSKDERQLVEFPAPAYHATLKSMRDHLRAISQIQGFLAEENYEAAADAAEKGLGQGHNTVNMETMPRALCPPKCVSSAPPCTMRQMIYP